ncbi:class I SAM-dependent methyltransferase [Sphingopyxis sp. MWB1]|uniref:class I SAM-dependent methyltransferase n=1 Tax=Sphingopyxis sp. MWB1 TaxID=1537715 RepID=UPI00068C323D|nr:class I SAM-dependent methyltransferase [Sphingopyxis sp. MWB1]
MTVFDSSYANQYDLLYADKDYVAECDLVAAAASSHDVAMSRVLDIGCGTGGHSLEWARRGVACVGVDMSPSMITLAEEKAAGLPIALRPEFLVGDAQSFQADGEFDVATMMFAVLGYMADNDAVVAALRNARRHLRLGGLFAFDCWYGPAVLSVRPEDRVRVVEGAKGQTIRSASTTVDSLRQLAHVNFRLWTVAGDRYLGHAEETHAMRFFFAQELKLLLQVAGFRLSSIVRFPDGGEPSDDSWNVFCECVAV